MKNFTLKSFENNIKKNRLFLLIATLFFIIAGVFSYLGLQKQNQQISDAINMKTLSLENVQEGDHAYINVNRIPYLFAGYETNGLKKKERFYLVMDPDDFLYIVYMDNKDFQKLAKDSITLTPKQITGTLRKIDSNIKKLAISSYNKDLQEEYLTSENFERYVGTYFLDLTIPLSNYFLFYLLSGLLVFLSLIFFAVYILNVLKTRKLLKKYSPLEIPKIEAEIYAINDNPYAKMKLYLTKNYLIDVSNSIIILNYKDIIWAYPYEYCYNGLLVNYNIKLVSKDYQHYEVCNTKLLKTDKDSTINEVLTIIKEKNKDVMIGNTKENREKVKLMKKNSKRCKKTI